MDGWMDGWIHTSFMMYVVCMYSVLEVGGMGDPSDTGTRPRSYLTLVLGGLRDEPRDMVELYRRGTEGL